MSNNEQFNGKTHLIIDTNHLLYRAKQITTLLTYKGQEGYHGLMYGDDITALNGMLGSIETLFRTQMGCPKETTVSFTFDHRNKERSEIYPGYKAGRPGLDGDDKQLLMALQGILRDMGFNVYSQEDFEADDIIASLVVKYADSFDATYIYTNDADLLTNLAKNVFVMRYKSTTSNYTLITEENFTELMSDEYGCQMPYNCILLYKALVGDPSDKIKGMPGFGKKAFDKLIDHLGSDYYYKDLTVPYNVRSVIEQDAEFICKSNAEKLEQAFLCLRVATPKIGSFELPTGTPKLADTPDKRRGVYQTLGFTRLSNRVK